MSSFDRILVFGIGTMGSGIAFDLANHGKTVYVHNHRLTQERMKRIQAIAKNQLEKGFITQEKMLDIMQKVIPIDSLENVSHSFDLAIEATSEDFHIKKEVLKEIEKSCGIHTVIATNTSSLSIRELASVLQDSGRLFGMHFFNPPYRMPLTELIILDKTPSQTIEKAKHFLTEIKKTWVEVKDSTGFIVNRLLFTMINEACLLLEEGAGTVHDIDTAMKLGAGYPMGPFELADFVGIDVSVKIMESLESTFGEGHKPRPILYEMLNSGKLGRKSKNGFYNY